MALSHRSLTNTQLWKVTKYIYSSTLLEYFNFMQLYTSTPLQFTEKYSTFYFTTFIEELKLVLKFRFYIQTYDQLIKYQPLLQIKLLKVSSN